LDSSSNRMEFSEEVSSNNNERELKLLPITRALVQSHTFLQRFQVENFIAIVN